MAENTRPTAPVTGNDQESGAADASAGGKKMMSHVVGYDSAQKSGYDTETSSPNARNATNEVHSAHGAPDREREEDEAAARRK